MGNKNKTRANDGFSAPVKAKDTKKGSGKTVISVICMVLVVALFAGVIVYNKVVDSGVFYRNTVSVKSENYEVNNAMLSYFFNSQYQNMAQSFQQMGVDTTKNLKDAQYTKDKSWFDYLMAEVTLPQVERILVLCEAAKAAGFELSDHDREHIDEAVKSVTDMAESYAKQYGGAEQYYIRNIYGHGVNIDDIRDAIELNQLAAAYSEHLTDSFEYTEADWDKYLEEHKDDFKVVDYVSYTFEAQKAESTETTTTTTTAPAETEKATSSSEDTTTTTADTTAAEKKEELSKGKQEAKDKAASLYQTLINTTEDATLTIFNMKVKDHLENVVYASTEDADKKAESVTAAMDATVTEAAANDESSDFIKFAFGKDRDKLAFMSEDDTNGRYTVYLITKTPYIEEYKTRNVRAIALSAATGDDVDEARESIMKEFEEKGKTEKAFEELAIAHSSDATAHENGGLYESQAKGDLPVDELNDWLYDDERKVGDYTYASNGGKDTEEVVYINYYTGEGLVKWQREVDSTMVSEAYDAEYQKLAEAHKVDADKAEAYKIPSQAGI